MIVFAVFMSLFGVALTSIYLSHILSAVFFCSKSLAIMREKERVIAWEQFLTMTNVRVFVDISKGWPSKEIWVVPRDDPESSEMWPLFFKHSQMVDNVPIRVMLARRIERLLPKPLVDSSSFCYESYTVMD